MQGIEPVDIVVHDFDSAQHEGSIRAVILCTAVGSELKPPKPTAEADHVRHLLIVEVEHGLFNVSLGADKFFAHSLPVSLSLYSKRLLLRLVSLSPTPSARDCRMRARPMS